MVKFYWNVYTVNMYALTTLTTSFENISCRRWKYVFPGIVAM